MCPKRLPTATLKKATLVSCLTGCWGADAQTSMGLRQFLTAMATVIGRDPTVFFEALLATCCVVRVAGRPIIQLKSPQKASHQLSDDCLDPFLQSWACPQLFWKTLSRISPVIIMPITLFSAMLVLMLILKLLLMLVLMLKLLWML